MDKLKAILEQYRNNERGLPTYAELVEIAGAEQAPQNELSTKDCPMQHDVATLSGALLDYFTALANGRSPRIMSAVPRFEGMEPSESDAVCFARMLNRSNFFEPYCPSAYHADDCRALVASKFGPTVTYQGWIGA